MVHEFQILHRFFATTGIHLYRQGRDSIYIIIHQALNQFISIITFISTSCFLFHNVHDTPRLIEGANIWFTGVIETIVLTVLLIYRKKIRQYLEIMAYKDNMYAMPAIKYIFNHNIDSISCPKLYELKNMVTKTQEKLVRTIKVAFTIQTLVLCFVSFMYALEAFYKFLTRANDSDRPLGYSMWFPWCLENKVVYIVTFIFHMYCGYTCAISYPAFQSIVFLLGAQVIRQLKILTFIFLNLDELGTELANTRGEQWESYCTEILIQCFNQYIKLKRFFSAFQAICQTYYLVLIINGTLVNCMTSVIIAMSPDKFALDNMKYFFHDFTYMIYIYVYCMYGQVVENECDRLDQALLEKWYIFNRQHRKNVLIFKIAASQGMPIYIFGSVRLSLTIFTWYIKTGMSVFTLVRSVLNEN